MIQKRDTSTWLRALSTATKLWMAVAMSVCICCIRNYWLSLAVMIFSYYEIRKEGMTGLFKFIAIATISMLIFMFPIYSMIVQEGEAVGENVLTYIGKVAIYRSGFDKAVFYFFRTAPLMAFLFLMFKSMSITDMGVVMCKCGLPYSWAFIFTDSFMLIPVLSKDMEQIMDAQKARGLVTEGNLITRMKAFVPIIVPVVANSVAKVQDQAVAMDTKGFNSKCKKSIYRELPNSKLDKILTYVSWAVIALSVAYIFLRRGGVVDVTNMFKSAADRALALTFKK